MSLPEELARTAIAHEEAAPGPGDKVRRTFGVVLARQQTEALAAREIWKEKNIATLVADGNHDHEPIPSLPHQDGPSGSVSGESVDRVPRCRAPGGDPDSE